MTVEEIKSKVLFLCNNVKYLAKNPANYAETLGETRFARGYISSLCDAEIITTKEWLELSDEISNAWSTGSTIPNDYDDMSPER